MNKKCRKCGIEKPPAEFYKYARGKFGVTAHCKQCVLARTKKYYEQNKDKYKKWNKASYANNIVRAKERAAAAYKNASPERLAELRKRSDEYWRTHPAELSEKNSRARFHRTRAVVAWRNKFYVREIYSLARLRTRLLGIVHHVDHIVPVVHPLVCGLHNEFNLAVLTGKENILKSNRHWPDMPDGSA